MAGVVAAVAAGGKRGWTPFSRDQRVTLLAVPDA